MINFLKNRFSLLDIHTKEVLSKSAASTIVKIAGMIFGLIVSVLLGRILGADGLGVINLSLQTTQILLILGLFGMRQVIVKEVAIGHSRSDWNHVANILHTSYWINGLITLAISLAMILASPWLSKTVFNEPRLTTPLIIASIALIPQVFSRIFSSALIGFRKIWQSNLADQTLSFAIIGLTLLILKILNREITIVTTAMIFALGRLSVMITLGVYWNKLFSYKSVRTFIGGNLIKTALPLLFVSSTQIITNNSSAIILGLIGDSRQVGLYSVALRIAILTSFFLHITNSAISPKLAALYSNKQIKEMEQMVQKVTKILAIIGISVFILFILMGKFLLNLWGEEFKEAYWILLIISAGQVFNISTGAAGLILVMCGHERTQRNISIYSIIANIFLNILLIYFLGIYGAAIATAISVSSINILKLIYAKRKIGILTIPLKNWNISH